MLDSLYFWLTLFTLLVILGVIMEGEEIFTELRSVGLKQTKHKVSKIGFALLVIGLAGELLFQTKIESADAERNRESDIKLSDTQIKAAEATRAAEVEHNARVKIETQLAIAQGETAKAIAEQERLKALVNWRSISPNSLNDLSAALSKSSGTVTLRYVATDAEAVGFAIQISKAFELANQIAGRQVWALTIDPHLYPNRLIFLLHIPDLNNESSRALQKAFSDAVIEYQPENIVEQSNGSAGMAGMTIGPMPLRTEALIIVGSKLPPF